LINNWQYLGMMNTVRHGLGIGAVIDTIYTISGGTGPGFGYSDVNEAFVPGGSIGIQQISQSAEEFSLSQNYPNPFNPSTEINFQIGEEGFVTLKVFDITGREVKMLISEPLRRGSYTYNLSLQNLASGIYIYSLNAGKITINKKMILIK
jgi:hypothetical protein